jgi:hypothetical protein
MTRENESIAAVLITIEKKTIERNKKKQGYNSMMKLYASL